MLSYLTLTPQNLPSEHLCCIIRSKKEHPGIEAKRRWLAARLPEGHVFRKLDTKGTAFIEYAPLETAWVPILGENYLYLYCLWVNGALKGKGCGRALMESCIADAKAQGRSGICMLGSQRQKNWLSSGAFAQKYGFTAVETTANGYTLLALSFDGTLPHFAPAVHKMHIESPTLTIYYTPQCPFTWQSIETVQKACGESGIPVNILPVDSLQKAKTLPCVFNNWAVFYGGQFLTVNLLDAASLARILK